MAEADFPRCFWCNKPIKPGDLAVKFPCPSCGRIVIWRCEKCRALAKPYKCPLCGFTGP
ncbi:MAG: zinc finger domain-containing protein [Candidatus Bathyarchaeia archaeon]